MACKLGLDNSDLSGGKYKGNGIASVLRWVYTNLKKDGFYGSGPDLHTGDSPNVMEPCVNVNFSKERMERLKRGEDLLSVNSLLSRDENFEEITCLGFGLEAQFGGDCVDCPYLSK